MRTDVARWSRLNQTSEVNFELDFKSKLQTSLYTKSSTSITVAKDSQHIRTNSYIPSTSNTANMSAEGVQNSNASEQVGSDTPMDSFDKGKGKAPADDSMMEEDDSSEDDEVSSGHYAFKEPC